MFWLAILFAAFPWHSRDWGLLQDYCTSMAVQQKYIDWHFMIMCNFKMTCCNNRPCCLRCMLPFMRAYTCSVATKFSAFYFRPFAGRLKTEKKAGLACTQSTLISPFLAVPHLAHLLKSCKPTSRTQYSAFAQSVDQLSTLHRLLHIALLSLLHAQLTFPSLGATLPLFSGSGASTVQCVCAPVKREVLGKIAGAEYMQGMANYKKNPTNSSK